MAEASSTLECPVCHEEFTDPKLLSCNHVVCGKCLADWLRKDGWHQGCPLCRAPIALPPPSGQDDVETLVNSLPTDLSIVARVEAGQIFSSPHVCMSCDNNTAADSFCLQCSMKLCQTCAGRHRRFPALKNHVIKELDNMTAEQLAGIIQVPCQSHDDRLVEMYCPGHRQVICLLCLSTCHGACEGVKTIKEAAEEKRTQFKREAQTLREKEVFLRTEIKKHKAQFTDMRAEAKRVFDDLHQCVERRHQEVNDLIQAEEDKMALSQQERIRAAAMSQVGMLDKLVTSDPDVALLQMEKTMTSRLCDLKQQIIIAEETQDPSCIMFDVQKLNEVKAAISMLGQFSDPSRPMASTSRVSAATPPFTQSGLSGGTATSTPVSPKGSAMSTPRSSGATATSTPVSSKGSAMSTPVSSGATAMSTLVPPKGSAMSTPESSGATATSTLVPPKGSAMSTPESSGATAMSTPRSSGGTATSTSRASVVTPALTLPGSSGAIAMSSNAKPRGAALARVLKVGDRVKRNPDFAWLSRLRGKHGTVTAFPSELASSQGLDDPSGLADVQWDCGARDCNSMGRRGQYHLDLL